ITTAVGFSVIGSLPQSRFLGSLVNEVGQALEALDLALCVLADPGLHLVEALGLERGDALLRTYGNKDEPGVAQHLEVARHAGLGEPGEVRADRAGAAGAPEQEVEDAAPCGVGDGGVGVHGLASRVYEQSVILLFAQIRG